MSFLEGRMGYEYYDKKEKEVEERRKSNVFRFWLPPEAETRIIFLDDNPAVIDEHQVKINGDWRNWISCLSMVDEPCPVCEGGDNPSLVAYYTIVDMTEWTDKKGNIHKNEIKLFGAKMETMKKLKRASNKLREMGKPGLSGAMFEVYRTGSDAANTGNDFTYIETLSIEEIKDLNPDAEVIDYAEVLKPLSVDEARRVLGKVAKDEYEDDFGYGDTIRF